MTRQVHERARRGVGRTEVLIGVAVVAVLGLIAVPLVLSNAKSNRRDAVREMVDEIREHEIEYAAAFSGAGYTSADPAPRPFIEVDETPIPWVSNRGFDEIGWAPDDTTAVYGAFRVSATADGFVVTGTCDLDGDGERAVFEASKDAPAVMKSENHVY
jgi:Tfp pilus assembly protein PilE